MEVPYHQGKDKPRGRCPNWQSPAEKHGEGQARGDLSAEVGRERHRFQVKSVCSSEQSQGVEGSRDWLSYWKSTCTPAGQPASILDCTRESSCAVLTKAEWGGNAALISLQLMGVGSHTTVLHRGNLSKPHLGLPQVSKEKTRENTAAILGHPQRAWDRMDAYS